MDEIINKCLLVGDKLMPEMHLRQPRFVYSACGPFTRHKERIKEFKRTDNINLLYRNALHKACFKHDAAYAKYKDVESRLIADDKLKNSAYDIASNPEYDGYQRGLTSMAYKFFNSKVAPRNKTISGKGTKEVNKILAEELHTPVIRKFNKTKVYSQFKDNIWGVDLADTRLLSKKNKGIKYLLCAIDLFSKYAFVVPLKDKKGISIINAFNKIIKISNRTPNKIRVDHGGEFYNHVFKRWLSNNDIIMYSTFNKGESVVVERFIRTLKNKLYKHMTAINKNVYYDVLDDVVYEYNNTKHNTIKMKPKDVKNDINRVHIDEYNKKDTRFNVGDRVRISKLKIYLLKGILLIGVKKYLLLIK